MIQTRVFYLIQNLGSKCPLNLILHCLQRVEAPLRCCRLPEVSLQATADRLTGSSFQSTSATVMPLKLAAVGLCTSTSRAVRYRTHRGESLDLHTCRRHPHHSLWSQAPPDSPYLHSSKVSPPLPYRQCLQRLCHSTQCTDRLSEEASADMAHNSCPSSLRSCQDSCCVKSH